MMLISQGARCLFVILMLAGSAAAARLRHAHESKKQGPYKQPLQNFQNTQYFADITIGGQKVKGIFDTGSFELLVRSTRCGSCAHPTRPYNHESSTTYKENGTLMKHVFGSGPCISMQGYETVSVGPMETTNQSFWEIVEHRIPVLDAAKFAAIVGIGPHFAPNNGEPTLLMSYGIDEFSVCLQRQPGSPGYLTWGSPRNEKDLKVATVPVIGSLHWAARMTKIEMVTAEERVGLKNVCDGKGCAAIVDSGTSLIAAPSAALMELSNVVGPVHEDCSNLNELPYLQFTLGGEHFELPPHAYVMRVTGAVLEADSVWDLLFFKPKIRKVNICIPAFMQLDMESEEGPVWILGMPFFRYYHTSFNRKDKTMHFATAGSDCEPSNYQNGTAFLSTGTARADDYDPTDIEVDAILPPTLTSMLDDDGKHRVKI